MLVSDFDYLLPEELIAQEPIADRGGSRMLRLNRKSGRFDDLLFRNLPQVLRPGDLLVLNNTRVFPARLYGRRSGSKAQPLSGHNPASRNFLQGNVEVLLTKQVSAEPNEWECLVRPGRKIDVGEQLFFGEMATGRVEPALSLPRGRTLLSDLSDRLVAKVIARGSFGERRIQFEPVADFFATLEQLGHVPLPPYVDREDRSTDRERYQTIYARERGSAAAPTAGLHFTPEILSQLQQRGIETAEVTLHVGLGTFQPVRVQEVEKHRLHSERYSIAEKSAQAVDRALAEKRRVVAVGTTTVRTLEYSARKSGCIEAGSGETNLFIYPGFQFRVVGAMLTNFHLPQSTLLMLVCAFGGRANVLAAYRHAVEQRYRFYSYGDCMFVE